MRELVEVSRVVRNRPVPGPFAYTTIAGVPVSHVTYESAAHLICGWAERGESRYVCVTSAHGVVEAQSDRELMSILRAADMVTPDGMPVVWALNLVRPRGQSRVYGPTLMLHVCREAADRRLPVFLYGATDDTLRKLGCRLTDEFPELSLAGVLSPPFRPLTEKEDDDVIRKIGTSGARIIFVGLSTPKQEYWMSAHIGRVRAVMVGVGAAFDFHAGNVPQAPAWMQRCGLEWLYRLLREPRRLWRRYVKVVPVSTALLLWQLLRGPHR